MEKESREYNLNGSAFKAIRMWAGISQENFMRTMGLKSRSKLSQVEGRYQNAVPLKYERALSKLIGQDLSNPKVVGDIIENRIPQNMLNFTKRLNRFKFIF